MITQVWSKKELITESWAIEKENETGVKGGAAWHFVETPKTSRGGLRGHEGWWPVGRMGRRPVPEPVGCRGSGGKLCCTFSPPSLHSGEPHTLSCPQGIPALLITSAEDVLPIAASTSPEDCQAASIRSS